MVRTLCLALMLLLSAPGSALAVQPDEVLDDPALEERARTLSAQMRCLVCQNQSIDDSDAPLARDLRVLIRQRLEAGDSDRQIVDFLVARYGEFILLKPRFTAQTVLLWLGPFALLMLGAAVLLYSRRNMARPHSAERDLSAREKRQLKKMLDRPD